MEQIKNKNNMLSRMQRDSQTILSKNKPHVRIIHIFAPEIIKTDPANFRELVQRLTGKPATTRRNMISKRKSAGKRSEADRLSSVEIVKSEEAAEIWRSSSSSAGSGDNESGGGFLTGFADMDDGFMQHFQSPLDLLPPNNHNPVTMIMHHHPQQQHHFFGQEDAHRRVL
uniref:VQ domain-containing protein n=1 Tax=Kalanchoe fedtschenkoi TaxID=63787 RepID=A0A7N0UV70_KALFE